MSIARTSSRRSGVSSASTWVMSSWPSRALVSSRQQTSWVQSSQSRGSSRALRQQAVQYRWMSRTMSVSEACAVKAAKADHERDGRRAGFAGSRQQVFQRERPALAERPLRSVGVLSFMFAVVPSLMLGNQEYARSLLSCNGPQSTEISPDYSTGIIATAARKSRMQVAILGRLRDASCLRDQDIDAHESAIEAQLRSSPAHASNQTSCLRRRRRHSAGNQAAPGRAGAGGRYPIRVPWPAASSRPRGWTTTARPDLLEQAAIAPVIGVGDGVFHLDLVARGPFLGPVALAVAVAGGPDPMPTSRPRSKSTGS